ncbi:hypothetical protein GIS00_25130 [Nakamurella sp. YIM 132087]|uniref:DUF5655 domain-containing protein n=1 Tax=Nakamurella alba TaxID=2665158 RepID=A0A7K1FSW0_9ACTN|nr:DUF5655 domain-containing protein [Nakamurella alba]MTD17218.1 hypothetical protein [Nakamurella alba]
MGDPRWSVEDHMRGKPAGSLELYRSFVELLDRCGPYELSPSKTTITFKGARRGFAGARPTATGLRCYLDLQRIVRDPRISSVSPYTTSLFVHHVTVTRPDQLDEEFAGWLGEAYAVGQGAHLAR